MANQFFITRGFGDMLMAASFSRGATWTAEPRHALLFPTRAKAEAYMRFYDISGAHVAEAV